MADSIEPGDRYAFDHRDKRTAYVVETVEGGGNCDVYVALLNPATRRRAHLTDRWLNRPEAGPGQWLKVT
jgi:hypothetical protein